MKNLPFIAQLLCAGLCLLSVSAQSTTSVSTGLPDGIVLPKSGTVFALDRKGEHSTLIQIHASEIASNSHAGSNAARSLVYSGPRSSIELKGLNAAVTLADARATFYVRINSDDPELMRARVHLIHLEQTKKNRVVSLFSQNIFGGNRQKKYDDIAIEKSNIEPDVWLQVAPSKPLEPGEYGIVFMPDDKAFSPESVYDFDIAIDAGKAGLKVISRGPHRTTMRK